MTQPRARNLDSNKDHEARMKRLSYASEDVTGFMTTITVVAYIEYYLQKIVESQLHEDHWHVMFPQDEDDSQRWELSKVLKLAMAMGLIDNTLKSTIMEFSKLRNRFAHNINYDLKTEDVKKIRKKINNTVDIAAIQLIDKFDNDEAGLTLAQHMFMMGSMLCSRMLTVYADYVDRSFAHYTALKTFRDFNKHFPGNDFRFMLPHEYQHLGLIEILEVLREEEQPEEESSIEEPPPAP